MGSPQKNENGRPDGGLSPKEIPTFVISLPSALDRRAQLLPWLGSVPFLSILMVEAVNGHRLPQDELRDSVVSSRKLWRLSRIEGLTAGEIGCAKSHAQCWSRMVDAGMDVALVLEDDVSPAEAFVSAIGAARRFLLRCSAPAVVMLGPRSLRGDTPMATVDGFRFFRAYDSVTTSSYLVNNAGARLLLETSFPLKGPIDAWFWPIQAGLSLFAIEPAAAAYLLDKTDSSIERERELFVRSASMRNRHRWRLFDRLSRISYKRLVCKWHMLRHGCYYHE